MERLILPVCIRTTSFEPCGSTWAGPPDYACELPPFICGRRHLLRSGKTTSGLNAVSVSEVRCSPRASASQIFSVLSPAGMQPCRNSKLLTSPRSPVRRSLRVAPAPRLRERLVGDSSTLREPRRSAVLLPSSSPSSTPSGYLAFRRAVAVRIDELHQRVVGQTRAQRSAAASRRILIIRDRKGRRSRRQTSSPRASRSLRNQGLESWKRGQTRHGDPAARDPSHPEHVAALNDWR